MLLVVVSYRITSPLQPLNNSLRQDKPMDPNNSGRTNSLDVSALDMFDVLIVFTTLQLQAVESTNSRRIHPYCIFPV